ncbi:Imm10 family immunity protein [Epibacterium sp. Ofav1-8]|uniref:Imm10 family immunity protein n=1 Tax=Epibacterium sp. Ofav1-8 TaxID=2917735 RepID=UPI001EF698FF|nr:Imm10 family immunity protein [Epibacterium sp. Ofav1-8]
MHSQKFKHASASKGDDYEMVAFGDASDGSSDYVLLQLAYEFDDQDRATGMDGIYLEINDQAHGAYKIVHRIEVFLNAVIIHFSSQQLKLPDTLNPFCIPLDDVARLSPDVCATLAGMACRAGIDLENKPTEY